MKYLKNIEAYTAIKVNDIVSHTGRKIASKAIIDSEHTEIRFLGSLKVCYNENDELIINEGEMAVLESDINYGVKALTQCKVCNILVKK